MRDPNDTPRVHPTAIIEEAAVVGARTIISNNVHVCGPGSIGRDCIIGEKTYIADGATVGDYVRIDAHVYVCPGTTIEDRVLISAGVIFTNERSPRAFALKNEGVAPEPGSDILKSTVRSGATVGAGALVGPGVDIGSYALVGMGSVVVNNVPPHGLVYGSPARLRGYVCICGTPLLAANRKASPGRPPTILSCVRCRRRYRATRGPDNRRFLTAVATW